MPIYEETYQSWHGQRPARPHTWFIISKTGIKLLWSKGMILFLILAYLPFLVRSVQIYLVSRLGDKAAAAAQAVEAFKINPQFFLNYLHAQLFYIILMLVFAGTGLIANDRKHNAFSLYFSKPVSLMDYISGKFIILSFYSLVISLVPGLLLFIIRLLLATDTAFLKTYYWVPFSIIASSLIIVLTLGSLAMGLSSLAARSHSAAVLFFAILVFPELLRLIFPGVKVIGLLSLQADLKQITTGLFGLAAPYPMERGLSVLVLVMVIAVSIFILWRRVRPVEVIQ